MTHSALNGVALITYDLDGTLIDSAPDLARAIDDMLVTLGHPSAGIAHVRHWVGNGSRQLVVRALAYAKSVSGQLLDESEIDHALDLFMQAYARGLTGQTTCYPGALECLRAQRERGIAQALITNKPARFITPILETLGLEEFFIMMLGGDSLPVKKPDPTPLLHIAERLDIAPAKALMVGDSKSDVLAAQAAGFRSLAVTYGYNHGEPIAAFKPDHLLDSLEDLV